MAKIILFLFTFMVSQDYVLVTFQIDMSNETISDNGVHLMGSDESYSQFGFDTETESPLPAWDPTSIQLLDEDGDNERISINVNDQPLSYVKKLSLQGVH